MRVLFYVDPLIERDSPLWKQGWLSNFVGPIISGLIKEGEDIEDFACVVPTSLIFKAAEVMPLKGRIVAIDQLEMIPKFGHSALEISTNWYTGEYDELSLESMASLLKERLLGFSPDICISFTPAPFLSHAWPDSKILNLEYGFISRPPFPETVYFDSLGMYQNSVLSCYESEIRSFEPSANDLNLVKQVRNDFCCMQNSSVEPLDQLANKFLYDFDSAVLLALQFSNYYAYDAHARFQSQYDLLIHVLSEVPENIAVIVCEHPEHQILDEETIIYLRNRYPNFVWNPLFREIHGASLQLLRYVKAVITVSSSIGLQSLLFKRPLIVVGGSHLNLVADSNDVKDLPYLLGKKWPQWKESVLAWLLNCYCVPLEMLCNSGRLGLFIKAPARTFFEVSNRLGRSKKIHDLLSSAYKIAFYNRSASLFRSPSHTPKGSIIPQVYVRVGSGEYSENSCLRNFNFVNGKNPGNIDFHLNVDSANSISVRFDPSDYPGLFLLSKFSLTNGFGEVIWGWDGDIKFVNKSSNVLLITPGGGVGVLLVCYGHDPFVEFTINLNVEDSRKKNLRLQGVLDIAPNFSILDLGKQINYLQAEATKRDADMAELHQKAVDRQEQINYLQAEATKRDADMAELHQKAVDRQEQINYLQAEATKRDADMAELHQKAVDRQEQINYLQAEATKRDADMAELHQKAVDRQEQINYLQAEATKRDADMAELHQKIRKMESTIWWKLREILIKY